MYLRDVIQSIKFYFRYQLRARHRKGHGIHSPAVYEFVRNVLFAKASRENYRAINNYRNVLKKNRELLKVEDLGAPSRKFRSNVRKVSEIYASTSIERKYGELLNRIVRYYGLKNIIELGTSLGVGTYYLAAATQGKVVSIEGNQALCRFAGGALKEEGLTQVDILEGDFDSSLQSAFSANVCFDLAYIDGNHHYEATIRYFEFFKPRICNGFIVIDDIYWSGSMAQAWKKIQDKNTDYVTIDLFHLGIVMLRDSITPGNYTIRF